VLVLMLQHHPVHISIQQQPRPVSKVGYLEPRQGAGRISSMVSRASPRREVQVCANPAGVLKGIIESRHLAELDPTAEVSRQP
jgi:hypothetical protein